MAEKNTKWMQAMSECLTAFVREQAGSSCPVVDYEVRADLAGGPDDMRVWFICRTEDEKSEFISTERSRGISVLKKKMLAAGLSESAVASVEIRVTSRQEVERSGGSSSFFH
jgi:hypothetical protein